MNRVGAALICTALGAGACAVPPSLSVGGTDAPVNSPPAIESVRVDGQIQTPPGPVVFHVSDFPNMTVDMIDTDVADTLYVGVFVDYQPGNELAARNSRCLAPPSADHPSARRTATCAISSVCVAADVTSPPPINPASLPAGTHEMTVVVFDRDPALGSGEPSFQALPTGGLSTSWSFFEVCMP